MGFFNPFKNRSSEDSKPDGYAKPSGKNIFSSILLSHLLRLQQAQTIDKISLTEFWAAEYFEEEEETADVVFYTVPITFPLYLLLPSAAHVQCRNPAKCGLLK